MKKFLYIVVMIIIIFIIIPVYEINIGNVTISWDMISQQSRHFSIEIQNDKNSEINHAFIISKNLHDIDGYQWHTLDIEGWYNIDERFFNMTFG